MNQQTIVESQFGAAASAYLTSSVHAQGQDLTSIKEIARRNKNAKILDLGCGAGHVSYAVASVAKKVIAYDLSEKMLAVVADSAKERQLHHIETQQGIAEKLPFEDNEFDMVVTRFSAHHWSDVLAALDEICRVLTPQGTAVIVDIVAPENALNDTLLQTVEILRDASHVRDYRISEWKSRLAYAGFVVESESSWKLVMQFDEWIKRMQTPKVRVDAIRDVFDRAAQEAKQYFSLQTDYSFSIDAALFEVRKYCA
jgi:ubiquinone/menaquinone biosynthesis C-methylase UbiE